LPSPSLQPAAAALLHALFMWGHLVENIFIFVE